MKLMMEGKERPERQHREDLEFQRQPMRSIVAVNMGRMPDLQVSVDLNELLRTLNDSGYRCVIQ